MYIIIYRLEEKPTHVALLNYTAVMPKPIILRGARGHTCRPTYTAGCAKA